MSSREFGEWLAYNAQVEPIGETRADVRLSMALTYISHLMGVKDVDPWLFFPYREAPDAEAQVEADVMSRGSLHSRPAGPIVGEPRARKKADEMYSRIRSWAMVEQIKERNAAERGSNGGS